MTISALRYGPNDLLLVAVRGPPVWLLPITFTESCFVVPQL